MAPLAYVKGSEVLLRASWLECAIDECRAEAAGGNKLPGRVGNPVAAQVVAPAVERASRSWNLGGLSLGRHLASYLSTVPARRRIKSV